jgi:hypothetical protein
LLFPQPSIPTNTLKSIKHIIMNNKTSAPFDSALQAKLSFYTTAALTGALSLGGANAAIVYVDGGDQLLTDAVTTDAAYGAFSFDLNTDGNSDLRLWTQDSTGSATPFDNNALLTAPVGAGLTVGVVGVSAGGFQYPSRLPAGVIIDGSANFQILPQVSTAGTVGWLADGHAGGPGYSNSEWVTAPDNTGYLGIRFKIAGADHFAWMRITVNPQSTTAGSQPRSIVVHEWAYESAPGVGLQAGAIPEPAGLGLLALGSVGLAARRRRK